MGLNHCGISGAGFAIPGIGSALVRVLESDRKIDIFSGVSSGALLTFVAVASNDPISAIKENVIGFTADVAFKCPPINKNNKVTLLSIYNLLTKNYMASQNKLSKTLKNIVSEDEWNNYINDFNSPDAIVLCVDYYSGSRRKINLKDQSYNDAIDYVVASSSIPIFANPIYKDSDMLYDGGVRNHIATEYIMDNYDLDSSISIYSRTEEFSKMLNFKNLDTSVEVLFRTLDIMNNEISKSDEQLEDLKAEKYNINNTKIFVPNILDNPYHADELLQKELYKLGRQSAINSGF